MGDEASTAKVDFAGAAWVDAARTVLEGLVAEHCDDDAKLSVCEVFTDVPTRVAPSGTAAWYFYIVGKSVTVGVGEVDDTDVKIRADYGNGAAGRAHGLYAGDRRRNVVAATAGAAAGHPGRHEHLPGVAGRASQQDGSHHRVGPHGARRFPNSLRFASACGPRSACLSQDPPPPERVLVSRQTSTGYHDGRSRNA